MKDVAATVPRLEGFKLGREFRPGLQKLFCRVEHEFRNVTAFRLGKLDNRKSLSVLAQRAGKANKVTAVVPNDGQTLDRCAVILDIRVRSNSAGLRRRSDLQNKNGLIWLR